MFDVNIDVLTETMKSIYLIIVKISTPYALLVLAFSALKYIGSSDDVDILALTIRRVTIALFVIFGAGTIVAILTSLAKTVDVLGVW